MRPDTRRGGRQTDDYASIINMGMGVSIEEKSMCEYTLQ